MRRRLLSTALFVTLAWAGGRVGAQTLPPPRVLPNEQAMPPVLPRVGQALPPMPLPPVYYRPSAYQVWQYYGRTYSGQFRPRVIDATGGAYYFYRGIPFPWVRVYPGEYAIPLAPSY